MFLDTRLGNSPRWFFSKPKDWAMRVPEELRKSVVFCARALESGSQMKVVFRGTGFIVSVPSDRLPDQRHTYIVTARHVADPLLLGNWIIRVNTKHGKVLDIRGTKDDRWWFHPIEPERVDVAVIPWMPPQTSDYEVDAIAIPLRFFLDDKAIEENGIGPGDEVFMTGLFNKMTQQSRNLPIVRTGNVSLIPGPGDLVPGLEIAGNGVDAEAYLVEARSIGGISGSPVFVRATGTMNLPSLNKKTGETRIMEYAVPGSIFLLGLVHGHWEMLAEDKNDPESRSTKKEQEDSVNMGIAVVIPAKKIKEVLFHSELIEMRNRLDQHIIDARGTTIPD
jgi:hypothetical protein